MELSLSHMLHIFNIFHENDGKENCAQVLEGECNIMFGTRSLYDEHDCNVVSMNSLNIHDANDMQSHKLGEAILMNMIFFVPQVLMCRFIMMITCLLFMMIILMNVGLEECEL